MTSKSAAATMREAEIKHPALFAAVVHALCRVGATPVVQVLQEMAGVRRVIDVPEDPELVDQLIAQIGSLNK